MDAHNILATTTNGFEFLQLVLQQSHPLLAIKNIATIDIPKYSTFKNLFRYAREIKTYVANHALRNRSFSEKETTHIFLSHIDDDRFKHAINKCEMAILHDTTVAPIYLVPAIAGTINQLAPGVSQDVPVPDTVQSHRQRDSRIQQLTDYCEDK